MTSTNQQLSSSIPSSSEPSALPQTATTQGLDLSQRQPSDEKRPVHIHPDSSGMHPSNASLGEFSIPDASETGRDYSMAPVSSSKSVPSAEISRNLKLVEHVNPDGSAESTSFADVSRATDCEITCSSLQTDSIIDSGIVPLSSKRPHREFELQVHDSHSKRPRIETYDDGDILPQIAASSALSANEDKLINRDRRDVPGILTEPLRIETEAGTSMTDADISVGLVPMPQELALSNVSAAVAQNQFPSSKAHVSSSDSFDKESREVASPQPDKHTGTVNLGITQEGGNESAPPRSVLDAAPKSDEVYESPSSKKQDCGPFDVLKTENCLRQGVSDHGVASALDLHSTLSLQVPFCVPDLSIAISKPLATSNCTPSNESLSSHLETCKDRGIEEDPAMPKTLKNDVNPVADDSHASGLHQHIRNITGPDSGCGTGQSDVPSISTYLPNESPVLDLSVSSVFASVPSLAVSFRSAPIETASVNSVLDTSAGGNDDVVEEKVSASESLSPPKKPRKQVRWLPDDKLSDIHYIDTRLQLIQNWDPDSEITLPFSAATLVQLRAQLRAQQDTSKDLDRPSIHGAPSLRSVPQVNEFELAKRRERGMELERARQVRQELQMRLDSMSANRSWFRPAVIILPSECRISSDCIGNNTESVDASDDTWENPRSGAQLPLSWIVSDRVVEMPISPPSPFRNDYVESENATVRIPLIDSAALSFDSKTSKTLNCAVGVHRSAPLEKSIKSTPFTGSSVASENYQTFHSRVCRSESVNGSQASSATSVPRPLGATNRLKSPHAVSHSPAQMTNSQTTGAVPAAPNAAVQALAGLPLPPQALQQLLTRLSQEVHAPGLHGMSTGGPPLFLRPPGMMPQLIMPYPGLGIPPHQMMPTPDPHGMNVPQHTSLQSSPHLPQRSNQQPPQLPQSAQLPEPPQLPQLPNQQITQHPQQLQPQHAQNHGNRGRKICRFFNTKQGCRDGPNCTFLHIPINSNNTNNSANAGSSGW